MANPDRSLSPRHILQEAAKEVCEPYAASVGQETKEQEGGKKSYAQVDNLVGRQGVGQGYGGLKPNSSRPYKLSTRVSEQEREILVGHAEKACLTLSEYVRLSLLESPELDPARNKLLLKANYELTKQGTNLNQIARHLNGGTLSRSMAEVSLAALVEPMVLAFAAVREALSGGRVEE